MVYRQQRFISHSSGSCEVQDQGTSIVKYWFGLPGSGLVPLRGSGRMVGGAGELCGVSSTRLMGLVDFIHHDSTL